MKADHEPGKYVSYNQVAERWNVSRDTVRRMCQKGELETMTIVDDCFTPMRRVLFQSVLDFEKEHTSFKK